MSKRQLSGAGGSLGVDDQSCQDVSYFPIDFRISNGKQDLFPWDAKPSGGVCKNPTVNGRAHPVVLSIPGKVGSAAADSDAK